MPIPDFNHNGALPPHKGNPTVGNDVSPFLATSLELCQKFSNTPERRTILSGFLSYRAALRQIGVSNGFQWVDGSFSEDVERLRGRPPGDLDVVTFYYPPAAPPTAAQLPTIAIITDQAATKKAFYVHHQLVNLLSNGELIVESARFWCSLFSHQRETEAWKGMLRIDLNTVAEDSAAVQHLASFNTP